MNNVGVVVNKIASTAITNNKISRTIQRKPFSQLTQSAKNNLSSIQTNKAKNTMLAEAIEYVRTGKATLKEALHIFQNKIKNL